MDQAAEPVSAENPDILQNQQQQERQDRHVQNGIAVPAVPQFEFTQPDGTPE
jgi:hypothetical protein